jgi:hypothetical protein
LADRLPKRRFLTLPLHQNCLAFECVEPSRNLEFDSHLTCPVVVPWVTASGKKVGILPPITGAMVASGRAGGEVTMNKEKQVGMDGLSDTELDQVNGGGAGADIDNFLNRVFGVRDSEGKGLIQHFIDNGAHYGKWGTSKLY